VCSVLEAVGPLVGQEEVLHMSSAGVGLRSMFVQKGGQRRPSTAKVQLVPKAELHCGCK